jgi:hypothetical protein
VNLLNLVFARSDDELESLFMLSFYLKKAGHSTSFCFKQSNVPN